MPCALAAQEAEKRDLAGQIAGLPRPCGDLPCDVPTGGVLGSQYALDGPDQGRMCRVYTELYISTEAIRCWFRVDSSSASL